MDFKDLTSEQIEAAKACKTKEELIELAEKTGFDLTDEQIDSVSGGVNWKRTECSSDLCEAHDSCSILY